MNAEKKDRQQIYKSIRRNLKAISTKGLVEHMSLTIDELKKRLQ